MCVDVEPRKLTLISRGRQTKGISGRLARAFCGLFSSATSLRVMTSNRRGHLRAGRLRRYWRGRERGGLAEMTAFSRVRSSCFSRFTQRQLTLFVNGRVEWSSKCVLRRRALLIPGSREEILRQLMLRIRPTCGRYRRCRGVLDVPEARREHEKGEGEFHCEEGRASPVAVVGW